MNQIIEEERLAGVQRPCIDDMLCLGYMSVVDGKWKTDAYNPCKPDQIIISNKKIIIDYTYPLSGTFEFTHKTTNDDGFTCKELSEQIMKRYAMIYKEEEERDGDPGAIEGTYNRAQSHGKYGIWGHCIGDLMLHSIYLKDNGHHGIGIDS